MSPLGLNYKPILTVHTLSPASVNLWAGGHGMVRRAPWDHRWLADARRHSFPARWIRGCRRQPGPGADLAAAAAARTARPRSPVQITSCMSHKWVVVSELHDSYMSDRTCRSMGCDLRISASCTHACPRLQLHYKATKPCQVLSTMYQVPCIAILTRSGQRYAGRK